MHLEQGRTINSLADEFGVSVSTIGRWVALLGIGTEKWRRIIDMKKKSILRTFVFSLTVALAIMLSCISAFAT